MKYNNNESKSAHCTSKTATKCGDIFIETKRIAHKQHHKLWKILLIFWVERKIAPRRQQYQKNVPMDSD